NAVNKFTPTSGVSELCAFCHTPHAASSDAPLWNRYIATPPAYTVYDTSTIDAPAATIGGISLACLSCHDGTQAMNTVLNAPGSGGYNATGGTWAGSWAGANQTGGKINAGLITNLTTDLSNDHPVSIPYGGGNGSSSFTSGVTMPAGGTADADFKAAPNAGGLVWYVDVGAAGAKTKTDMILYTNAATSQPFVECGTCHDPHSTNATFLRTLNTNSQVCLACHNK
ncbi:MAG: hypothetical protein OEV15_04795, partial [Gallionella sp.]|nr:hypothetical protein [Gallionella sp.]